MELPAGIRRITTPLPTPPGHVHSYLLPGVDGWTLVDTGLALPDAMERWAEVLLGLDLARVLITHFHPDHMGAAADVAQLAQAPIHQSGVDYEQCRRVWRDDDWPRRLTEWFLSHGVPSATASALIESGSVYRPFIRLHDEPVRVRSGDRFDGWELLPAPGHADGQLVLSRAGILVSADHLLGQITPNVGLWPESRPDPLGDFIDSLRATIDLAPELALPGHGDPIADPVARAHQLIEHHRLRLEETEAALRATPRTAYEISYDLFGGALEPGARRFALAETLSHLERLVCEDRAERRDDTGMVAYTTPRRPRRRSGRDAAESRECP